MRGWSEQGRTHHPAWAKAIRTLRRRRTVPIIEPLRPALERLTADRDPAGRLLSGPRGGVITTATLRDATRWDDVVREIGQTCLVRHDLRHPARTWMADAVVELHILQRVAGHQDPAVTSHCPHPDVQSDAGRGSRDFCLVVSPSGPQRPNLAVVRRGRGGHEKGA
ncbi:MAG TPA: tyrosine-type recombinase/integrase [Nocardioidaceae bacterium]|nr:tyrosine-type recombinase/integrase [Nocardioidaceae bacterium]